MVRFIKGNIVNHINQNIENRFKYQPQQPAFKSTNAMNGSDVANLDVQLPDIYYTPDEYTGPKNFKETVKQFDLFNIIYPWLTNPFAMFGTCAGMAFSLDKFIQACGGEYEKSIVGKAARLGDKLEESKFIKSEPVQKVYGWGKTGIQKINHFFRNSDVINAIKNTPSKPEWSWVKEELIGQERDDDA